MKQSQRYKSDHLLTKYQIYYLLRHYYAGKAWREPEIFEALTKEYKNDSNDKEETYLSDLLKTMSRVEPEAVYEFNKLFIGPGKLLAPPYESAYRNPESILMQKETLALRKFYSSAGIRVRKQNSEPDDHLVLELEFICYLLFKADACKDADPVKSEYYLELYSKFLVEHLGKWIFDHCEDVLRHSSTKLCWGMAMITKRFIENEFKQIA